MGIPILMYHSIDLPAHPAELTLCLPPEEFGLQMRYLGEAGYTPISLDTLLESMATQTPLPLKPVVLTFDDGYADFYQHAFPVLSEHAFLATIFLVSGCIGGINSWDAHVGLPGRRILGWGEIREMMGSGIHFGSHGLNHRRLDGVSADEARQEIEMSKGEIEGSLGKEVRHFSYPYGGVNEEVARMVREAGYLSACTTMSGFNGLQADPFLLRRLDICGTDTLPCFIRKLTYGTNDGSMMTSARYYWKRVRERVGL